MYNQFTGVGRLSADPTSRYTQSGKHVANFTVCCDTGFGEKKQTEFVRCVAWEKTADAVANYLTKGSKVMIIGPMQTRAWDDKDGNKRYSTEINVREMRMLDSKGSSSSSGNHGEGETSRSEIPDYGDLDVPF